MIQVSCVSFCRPGLGASLFILDANQASLRIAVVLEGGIRNRHHFHEILVDVSVSVIISWVKYFHNGSYTKTVALDGVWDQAGIELSMVIAWRTL